MYYQNWENFKKHVEDNETRLVIPPEELSERLAAVRKSTKAEPKVTNGDEAPLAKSTDLPNGTEKGEEKDSEKQEMEKETEGVTAKVTEAEEEGEKEKLEEEETIKENEVHGEDVAKEEEKAVKEEVEEVKQEEGENEKESQKEKAVSPSTDAENQTSSGEAPLTAADWKEVKQRFIEDREKVYQKTYEQITKRWYFEEKIRRPYFHVKPLEKSQLDNWREYLVFEIEQGEPRRVTVLFERCLIACALYEEFWMRYADYLQTHDRPDQARGVWRKACSTHLSYCPELHWRWAMFEESQGNPKAAAEIITRGQKECSSNVRLCTRRLALLRRAKLATGEALCAEFEAAIERFASENTASASLLSLKYARYLCRARGDLEKAERVLREAIARDETNERLYLQLVDLNYTHTPTDVTTCDRILAWIVSLSVLPRQTRLRFCQRRCELLEESSDDITLITAALKALEELKKESEAAGEAETEATTKGGSVSGEYAADASEAPPSKRARTAGGATTGAAPADTYAATAAAPYDQHGGYPYGEGGVGDVGAADGHGEPHGHGGAASYAAAAAAAAANAAYPGYGASGGGSWDSYYNSYYGYYAGYYGATGNDHNDWQMQNAS